MMVTLTKDYHSQKRFDQALTVMRQLPLPFQPTIEEKLKLQIFYNQSLQSKTDNINNTNNNNSSWDSEIKKQSLSPSQAQEEYYKAVLQLLKRYSDRPFIYDIIESLERGKRISEIKLPEPRSLPLSAQSSNSQEDYFSCPEDMNDTSPPLTHLSLNINHRWMENSIPVIKTPSVNSIEDTPLDPLSSDELDYSSDDGATMSTCTVRANNFYSPPDNQNLDRNLLYPSRLPPEAEHALETLQTQVASLNERLEVIQKELNVAHVPKKEFNWKELAINVLKKSAVHLIVMGLIFVQTYRNRPYSYRLLLTQLMLPFYSILKYLLKSIRKLLR
ncbi:hypothetical protein K502DRAFT_339559 [Neoconidiobolus thromboides FSU 785]|nr:hypothetical protein K502DRAFT_339559 [Neoconidiobolus thromboides FSU 785]